MNFKDRLVTNERGEKFIFTVEMQRQLSAAGLPIEPEALDQLPDKTQKLDDRAVAKTPAKRVEKPSEPETFAAPETIQIDPQTGKYIGRMKWYNSKKGYGFIIRGGGEEIFFHKTGTVGDPLDLQEGQWILYDVEDTRKGAEATEVEPYQGDTDLLEG